MTDIDWSKAPEGATHYNAAEGGDARFFPWMKSDGDSWYFHHTYDGVWKTQKGDFPSYSDALIARPSPQWSGDGLPPAGELCEAGIPHVSGENSENRSIIWIEGRVIAYHEINGKTYAWFAEGDGFYPPGIFEFRPVKTPAQIAAEEREAAIDDLTAGFSNDTLRSWAIRAYDDLGYRKQEKPE